MPRADDTDWPQILALYGLLEQMTGAAASRTTSLPERRYLATRAARLKLDAAGD